MKLVKGTYQVRLVSVSKVTLAHGKVDPVAAASAFVPVQSGRAQLLAPAAAYAHQVRVARTGWRMHLIGIALAIFNSLVTRGNWYK